MIRAVKLLAIHSSVVNLIETRLLVMKTLFSSICINCINIVQEEKSSHAQTPFRLFLEV